MIKAVLFDLDGVLVDSYEPAYRTLLNCFAKMGLLKDAPPKAIFLKKAGLPFQAWLKEFLPGKAAGNDFLVDDAASYAEQKYEKFFLPILGKTMAGAEEALEGLRKKRVKTAVVTNNPRYLAEQVLESRKLKGLLDVLVTRSDVTEPKPSAEPLVKAMELLGVGREEVIYVGDSKIDVEAAENAKIKFILLKNAFNKRLKARKANSLIDLLLMV